MSRATAACNRPTDICIVLSAFPAAHEDGWIDADRVAGRLNRLGFDCKPQQVAAWLARLSRMDAPPIEVYNGWWHTNAYRVTPYGETWIHNKLPDIWCAQQTMRDRRRQGMAA